MFNRFFCINTFLWLQKSCESPAGERMEEAGVLERGGGGGGGGTLELPDPDTEVALSQLPVLTAGIR